MPTIPTAGWAIGPGRRHPRWIPVPWILGLYSLAGVTFLVAARIAGWQLGPDGGALILPFAVVLGGAAQILAAVWAFEERDGLAATMLGTWGSAWTAYGLMSVFLETGALPAPAGLSADLGLWFIPLAAVTWMGAVAALAARPMLAATLALLAAGASLAAFGGASGRTGVLLIASWMFMLSGALAWYTATTWMFDEAARRPVRRADRTAPQFERTQTVEIVGTVRPVPGPAAGARRAS